MSSATPTAPTTPRVTLTFQLDPVKLVATRVETAGAYGETDDQGWKKQFLTSSLRVRSGDERALRWTDPTARPAKPKAFEALILALVRLKYFLDLYAERPGKTALLSGNAGSPAVMLKGVLDRSSPAALAWLRDFCGYTRVGPGSTTFPLASWFDGGKTTPGDKNDTSFDICCNTSPIPPDHLLIAIHDPKSSAVGPVLATPNQILLIADALAKLAKWGSPDTLTFPPKLPRPPLAPALEPARPASPAVDPKHRDKYLRRLLTECLALPLTALGGNNELTELTLNDVYIELETRSPALPRGPKAAGSHADEQHLESGKTRRLTAIAAATKTPRLVLLGDPGSGKSTFVKRLTALQAAGMAKKPPRSCPPEMFPRPAPRLHHPALSGAGIGKVCRRARPSGRSTPAPGRRGKRPPQPSRSCPRCRFFGPAGCRQFCRRSRRCF